MDDAEEIPFAVAELVRGVEPGTDVGHRSEQDPQGNPLAAFVDESIELLQRIALDPLHDDVRNAFVLAEIDHLRDVRVDDARGDTGLVEEHLVEGDVLDQVRKDRLDREELLETASTFEARDEDL